MAQNRQLLLPASPSGCCNLPASCACYACCAADLDQFWNETGFDEYFSRFVNTFLVRELGSKCCVGMAWPPLLLPPV